MLKFDTRKKMLAKATSFLNTQNQYFSGQITDARMTEITTQPFWQSMRLSKKRLEEKELIAETTVAKAAAPMKFISDTSNSRSEIGNFSQPLKEHKKIYSRGKLIYNKKDDKICMVSAIKANGDGENATCPNCGGVSKISTYIDGCDFCGSKFTVNDFEEKISSFSMEENTPKKVLNAFKYIVLVVGILAGVFGLVSVLSIILAVILDMFSISSTLESYTLIIYMVASEIFPIFGKIFTSTGTIFIFVFIFAFILLGRQVTNTKMVKSQIRKFSPEDFTQNLEFKLRNIHFASDAKEVNVYSHFDLSNVITNYKDVIECTLSRLSFKSVHQKDNKFFLEANLICSLTKYCDEKVWVESEKVAITVSAPEDLQAQTLGSIHCYYCPNCSSSINLLNGGVCDYCGTKLDYSKYSWMIEHYESNGKVMNPFAKIKWLLLAIYAGLFIVLSLITLSTNYESIYQTAHYEDCFEVCHEEFDTVALMYEVVPGILPYSTKNSATERVQSYYVDDTDLTASEAVQAYGEYLGQEGFHLKDVSDTSYLYYRVVSYPDIYLEGHFELEISYDEETGEIVVEYRIDDSPYEE